MKKRTIQEVADFFGVPMRWDGEEVVFMLNEYTSTRNLNFFVEQLDVVHVVRFDPKEEEQS